LKVEGKEKAWGLKPGPGLGVPVNLFSADDSTVTVGHLDAELKATPWTSSPAYCYDSLFLLVFSPSFASLLLFKLWTYTSGSTRSHVADEMHRPPGAPQHPTLYPIFSLSALALAKTRRKRTKKKVGQAGVEPRTSNLH
jgi:hypothetical protein